MRRQRILKPVTRTNEIYVRLTSCFNLNVSFLLTAIIASVFLYSLPPYYTLTGWWSPVKRCHRLPDEVSSHPPEPPSIQTGRAGHLCRCLSGSGDYTHFQIDTAATLPSTLDARQQELSKLSGCQTATYHVNITSGRPSCSLWFILPRWGWQWPCEECFNLTTLQRRLVQRYSRCWQTKLLLFIQGWRALSKLQGVIEWARRRILQRLSQRRWDSSTQLMKRKWWEVRGDQSQVRRSTRKLRVGGSGSSEGNDSGHLNVSYSLMIARRSRTSSAVLSCESVSNAT